MRRGALAVPALGSAVMLAPALSTPTASLTGVPSVQQLLDGSGHDLPHDPRLEAVSCPVERGPVKTGSDGEKSPATGGLHQVPVLVPVLGKDKGSAQSCCDAGLVPGHYWLGCARNHPPMRSPRMKVKPVAAAVPTVAARAFARAVRAGALTPSDGAGLERTGPVLLQLVGQAESDDPDDGGGRSVGAGRVRCRPGLREHQPRGLFRILVRREAVEELAASSRNARRSAGSPGSLGWLGACSWCRCRTCTDGQLAQRSDPPPRPREIVSTAGT